MARFPPSTSVEATIAMTRTAYAQLVGQRFHPPKVFGSWKEDQGSAEWRHKDIGMKVVGTSTPYMNCLSGLTTAPSRLVGLR